ncbi:MAG: RDD family protein, partial [Desulfobulbaceae bacterium]|nr:RDD family protein [Desulfobulbaceae bacterium]
AQMPVQEIIRQIKIAPLPVRFFLVPFFFIIFLFCKSFKRPLPVNVFLTNLPKIKVYPPGERQDVHKCFPKPCAVLSANGFAPLFDYEDLATPTKHYCRLFIHKQEKVYAVVAAETKHTPRAIITFFSYLKSKKALYYANDFEFPLDDQAGLIRRNFTHMDETALLKEIRGFLASSPHEAVLLKPGSLLVLRQKIRTNIINASLRAGYFSKRTGSNRVTTCTNHAMLHAEFFCSVCRTPLCMGCKRRYRETIYCEDCLPVGAKEIGRNDAPPELPDGLSPAGVTVRASAALLDLLFFSTSCGIVIYGMFTAAPLLFPSSFSGKISWFTAQFFGIVFLVFYLVWPLLKFGRTPGQAAFGLQTVDRRMNPISGAAVFVRNGYHLLSFLFIFPAVGYLTAFFNKSKQGLHDKISGTLVITRRATAKAVMAGLLMLSLLGGAISGLSMTSIGTALPFFYSLVTNYPQPEVALEPIWQQSSDITSITILMDQQGSTYFHDFDNQELTARDAVSGKILWQRHDIVDFFYLKSTYFPHDMVAVISGSIPSSQKILFLSRFSGTILWEKEVHSNMPPIVSAWEGYIFIQEDTTVSTYDLNGHMLWQKNFPTTTKVDLLLNGEIVAEFYDEDNETYTQYFLTRTDGKTIWRRNGASTRIIGQGYQLLTDYEQNIISLMRMDDQKIIWKNPMGENQYHNHLITGNGEAGDIPDGFLYTTNNALRIKDGLFAFRFPAGYTFLNVTDKFIILHKQNENTEKEIGNKKLELLLLERKTGEIIYSFRIADVDRIVFLSDNKNDLFFMTTRYEDEKALRCINDLLVINKKSGSISRKNLGKNLSMARVTVVDDKIVIVKGDSAGAYHL